MVSGSVITMSQYFLEETICEVVNKYPKPFSMGSFVIGQRAFNSGFFLPRSLSKKAIIVVFCSGVLPNIYPIDTFVRVISCI